MDNFASPLRSGMVLYRALPLSRGPVLEKGEVRSLSDTHFTVETSCEHLPPSVEVCPRTFPGNWCDSPHAALITFGRRIRIASAQTKGL